MRRMYRFCNICLLYLVTAEKFILYQALHLPVIWNTILRWNVKVRLIICGDGNFAATEKNLSGKTVLEGRGLNWPEMIPPESLRSFQTNCLLLWRFLKTPVSITTWRCRTKFWFLHAGLPQVTVGITRNMFWLNNQYEVAVLMDNLAPGKKKLLHWITWWRILYCSISWNKTAWKARQELHRGIEKELDCFYQSLFTSWNVISILFASWCLACRDHGGAVDMMNRIIELKKWMYNSPALLQLQWQGVLNELNQFYESIQVYERYTGRKGFRANYLT